MRRDIENRLRRETGLGLCLLVSVLIHLLWLAILFLPAEDHASPAVTRVFLVTAEQGLPACAADKTRVRAPFMKKSKSPKASLPSVTSPAEKPPPAISQRPVSAATSNVAMQPAATPLVQTTLSAPVAGPTDTVAVDGSRAMIRRGGNDALRGTLGRGDGQEPDPELGSSGAAAFLYRAVPRYPPVAHKLGREGTVTLRLAIAADGALRDVEVLRGAGYGFTEAALDALARSTFRPAVRGGRPVDSRAVLRVVFALRNQR